MIPTLLSYVQVQDAMLVQDSGQARHSFLGLQTYGRLPAQISIWFDVLCLLFQSFSAHVRVKMNFISISTFRHFYEFILIAKHNVML